MLTMSNVHIPLDLRYCTFATTDSAEERAAQGILNVQY